MHEARRLLIPLLSLSLLAACGDGGSAGDPSNGFAGTIELDVTDADRCDPLDRRQCLFPFPSDFFTRPDATSDTGLRIALPREGMPANVDGVRVDTTEWNRNDGFSPGSQILTYVAGVDLAASGAAPITDIGRSLDPAALTLSDSP